MGVTLEEINEAFMNLPNERAPNKDDWHRLSHYWQQGLNKKIAYLEKLRDSLDGCIGCGCLSMKNCPIYNAEDKLGDNHTGPVLLDKSTK
jgi:MerR family redox-sensitive transcriptional activator SoxR